MEHKEKKKKKNLIFEFRAQLKWQDINQNIVIRCEAGEKNLNERDPFGGRVNKYSGTRSVHAHMARTDKSIVLQNLKQTKRSNFLNNHFLRCWFRN